jgi:L-threonylcarbamoyladenylate synthase
MHTETLVVDPAAPEPEKIARASAVLRRGGLVAFPTETVYGLGANALDAAATAGIFRAKGRPANNPVIVHVADAEAALPLVADWPETAGRLARCFWPGPLTLVLPKRATVPDIVTAGGPTVAVRVPAHPVALALLRAAGVPVAAPSANRSSQLSPTRAEHVLRALDGLIDMVVDAGPTTGGLESTVLDLTCMPPRLLRPGLVSVPDLEAIVGPITQTRVPATASALLPSPGMMNRHYAPRTPLECVEGDASERVRTLINSGERVGWVVYGRWMIWANLLATAPEFARPNTFYSAELPCDPAECAATLYDLLHHLDEDLAGVVKLTRIVVELPPDTPEWLAVRDRLRRASAS